MAEPPSFFGYTGKDARLNPEMASRGRADSSACNELPTKERNGMMASPKERGFSLVELMVVIGLILLVASFSWMAIQPSLRQSRVTSATNTLIMAMRLARDTAIGQRQIYFVTLQNNGVNPSSITITQGSTGNVIETFFLPFDITYAALPGIPTSQGVFPTTPDRFGTGGTAIDFDQGIAGGAKNVLYFYPDGSAQDVNGNTNNGVVYIARANDLYSSRAITVWGATGRMRSWRLYPNGGSNYWRQQ